MGTGVVASNAVIDVEFKDFMKLATRIIRTKVPCR